MNNENRDIYISLENLTEFKELNDSLTDEKLGAKYTKPQTGIPKTDLAQSVQDSLDLADSAIQTHQDLSNYVTFDDTPSTNKAGVVKANEKYNFATGNSSEKGIPLCAVNDYATYLEKTNFSFISKGTLENVITGKALVSDTNYATAQTGGVIKTGSLFNVNSNGVPYGTVQTFSQYSAGADANFISKGTLENVIEGKELISSSDLANNTTPGIVKTPNWSGINITDGDIYVKNHTYAQYLEANGAIAINKNTLEDVITGKNLETANNKVTSLSASSTDTQYPSAKAVYDTITDKISSVYRYKGSVADYDHLPSTDLTVGDVYNIEATDPTHEISAGDNVAWTGTVWDKLSGTVDLSGYQTKIDSSHKLSSDLVDDTGNTNLFVTSSEKSTWSGKQDALTAGDNITISGNTISATDTTYDDATTSVSGLMSATDKTKLDGIATGAEVNVQANWNETDTDSDAYIQNKPTIPDELSDLTDDSTHRLVTDTEKSTWNGKQDVIQYSTMPTASADLVDSIVQYVGGTTSEFTQGHFYLCMIVGGSELSYQWTEQEVQTPQDLSRFLAKDNTTAYTPTGDYNPATKLYVDSGLSNKQDSLVSGTNIKTINGSSVLGAGNIVTEQIQYSSVPTANAANLGKIIQYTGTSSSSYHKGYFYICSSDGEQEPTYKWVRLDLQPVNVEPSSDSDIDDLFN